MRDNVILPNDEVDLMHLRPTNCPSFSGWVRSALSPKGSVSEDSEVESSAARDLACDVETYSSLFGNRRLREIKGSRPLEELVEDLRSGHYDLVVCSTGKPLRCLQSSLAMLADEAGDELFSVPIVVLPKFNSAPAVACLKGFTMENCTPRKIAVGVSGSPDSFLAFSWAMHHLVRPGDTMVNIHTHTKRQRHTGRDICSHRVLPVCPPSFPLSLSLPTLTPSHTVSIALFLSLSQVLIHVKYKSSSRLSCQCATYPSFTMPEMAVTSESPRRSPLPPEPVLAALEQQCRVRGLNCITVMTTGKPTHEFVEWCKFHMCDLAVVGSRGMQMWIERAVRKSVSQYAVKHVVKEGTGVIVVADKNRHALSRLFSNASHPRQDTSAHSSGRGRVQLEQLQGHTPTPTQELHAPTCTHPQTDAVQRELEFEKNLKLLRACDLLRAASKEERAEKSSQHSEIHKTVVTSATSATSVTPTPSACYCSSAASAGSSTSTAMFDAEIASSTHTQATHTHTHSFLPPDSGALGLRKVCSQSG